MRLYASFPDDLDSYNNCESDYWDKSGFHYKVPKDFKMWVNEGEDYDKNEIYVFYQDPIMTMNSVFLNFCWFESIKEKTINFINFNII